MGPTVEELNKVLEIKNNIKQAIADKGVEITDDTAFADYPSKIESIESGGGGDPYYETLWNACTNNNTDYSYLFEGYNGTELDVSKFDTSNVQDMNNMFATCQSLKTLDVSNFNTSNVKDMNYMFYYCKELTSLGDISNFNTSNVKDMKRMFYNCKKLTSLGDISNWDTSNVKDMAGMFYYCQELTSLGDISNWDTSNVTSMTDMFNYCKLLVSLDLSKWNVDKVTAMGTMFTQCDSLTTLNVSGWDVSHITGSYVIRTAFDYCKSLVDFYPPQNINAEMSVSSSTALSHDSLMRIINNLMTTTTTKKLTLGKDNLAKLSDEEKQIATGKGWTLA